MTPEDRFVRDLNILFFAAIIVAPFLLGFFLGRAT